MIQKYTAMIIALLLITIVGCGGKKADPAQIQKANEAVAKGDFENGITVLDSLAKESPNDDALKQARADAHMKYGDYLMYDSPLPPHQKYPGALKQYRIVALLDPSNQQAKQNITMIESIYNQMGRPIPQ
jgi:tetratricopeptide (TPR) repeat protein